jgi:hypothetical protein
LSDIPSHRLDRINWAVLNLTPKLALTLLVTRIA